MFKRILKELREQRGLSQKQLADVMGVSQSTVGNWESGSREPNFETVAKLADYFGVSVDVMLGRPEDGPTYDEEANAYLDLLHKRDDIKMLFSVAKNATREDIEMAVEMIERIIQKNQKY